MFPGWVYRLLWLVLFRGFCLRVWAEEGYDIGGVFDCVGGDFEEVRLVSLYALGLIAAGGLTVEDGREHHSGVVSLGFPVGSEGQDEDSMLVPYGFWGSDGGDDLRCFSNQLRSCRGP